MRSCLQKIVLFCGMLLISNLSSCKTAQTQQDSQTMEQSAEVAVRNTASGNSESVPKNITLAHADEALPPAVARGPVPPQTRDVTMYYYVQKGDTLAGIAKKICGNADRWVDLAKENNITSPNQIYAGDFIHYRLSKTTLDFANKYENKEKSKIAVKQGDTLYSIAKKVLGHGAEWRVLWKQNPQVKDPDKLTVGQQLLYWSKEAPDQQQSKEVAATPLAESVATSLDVEHEKGAQSEAPQKENTGFGEGWSSEWQTGWSLEASNQGDSSEEEQLSTKPNL